MLCISEAVSICFYFAERVTQLPGLSLIKLAMKAISAVLGCLNYQQLSDTELAKQRYTLMVFSDFYALEFGFFMENMFITVHLFDSFCFSHAIYEDIAGCFSDRNSVPISILEDNSAGIF